MPYQFQSASSYRWGTRAQHTLSSSPSETNTSHVISYYRRIASVGPSVTSVSCLSVCLSALHLEGKRLKRTIGKRRNLLHYITLSVNISQIYCVQSAKRKHSKNVILSIKQSRFNMLKRYLKIRDDDTI